MREVPLTKPHIRLRTKRPNGGAWFTVVRYPGTELQRSFGLYGNILSIYKAIRDCPH